MPLETIWLEKAEAHQLNLTKPPKSLGVLEEIANRICAIQTTLMPSVKNRRLVVCVADHGVCEENISPFPSEVTAQMVLNFLNGGAAINALANIANAKLSIVNVGVKGEINFENNGENEFIDAKITGGTKNFAKGEAMSEREMLSALKLGIEVAQSCKKRGETLIGLGEMGIGNTTSASAITSALTMLSPTKTTGRGTGANDEMLAHKIEVVKRALEINQPNKNDALDILQKVGGLEIACLVGVCLGAASEKIAIVTDGFIATSAVALAAKICPHIADYVFASHLSQEKGHVALLEFIGQKPLFDLQMRLGEGTGAALAINIIASAVGAFNEMATFESAKVNNNQ